MRIGLAALLLALVSVGCGDDLDLDLDGEEGGELPATDRGQKADGPARVEPGAPAHVLAEVVVDDALGASHLQVAHDRIYWIAPSDDGYQLRYARPTGGPVTTVLKFGRTPPSDLTFAGDDVYWGGHRGRLYRTSMDVSRPVELLYQDGAAAPTALAAGVKYVYFGAADGCVRRIGREDGARVEPVACAAGTPVALAASEPDVFWGTAEGDLYWAPADGGAADKRIAGESFDSRLWIDETAVYWLNAQARAVQVMDRDAHGAKQLARAQYAPVGMSIDRSDVYFTTLSDQSVKRVSKLEGPVEVLVDQQAEPADVALHGDRIYWLNEGQGTVMALPIP